MKKKQIATYFFFLNMLGNIMHELPLELFLRTR